MAYPCARAKTILTELGKSKDLKGCKFNEEDIKECAGKMLASMMKYDMKRAEGYKLVLMLCLKIFESQPEDKSELVTDTIKSVRSGARSSRSCCKGTSRSAPSVCSSTSSSTISDNTSPSRGTS